MLTCKRHLWRVGSLNSTNAFADRRVAFPMGSYGAPTLKYTALLVCTWWCMWLVKTIENPSYPINLWELRIPCDSTRCEFLYPIVGAFAIVTGSEFLPITLPAEISWYPPDDAPAQTHLVHQTAEAGLGKAGEMMGLHHMYKQSEFVSVSPYWLTCVGWWSTNSLWVLGVATVLTPGHIMPYLWWREPWERMVRSGWFLAGMLHICVQWCGNDI